MSPMCNNVPNVQHFFGEFRCCTLGALGVHYQTSSTSMESILWNGTRAITKTPPPLTLWRVRDLIHTSTSTWTTSILANQKAISKHQLDSLLRKNSKEFGTHQLTTFLPMVFQMKRLSPDLKLY